MAISTQLIKHSEASKELLESIANIKSIRWQYPLEKQLQWMNDNLQQNDVHLLVYFENNLIAYTNFVNVEVIINDVPTQFMGIGNVCTSESGKGYGDILMNAINNSINQNNWNGILLCKDSLVSYYEKYNWILISIDLIQSESLKMINTMFFNFATSTRKLQFNNPLF